jgi:hypothetical protein
LLQRGDGGSAASACCLEYSFDRVRLLSCFVLSYLFILYNRIAFPNLQLHAPLPELLNAVAARKSHLPLPLALRVFVWPEGSGASLNLNQILKPVCRMVVSSAETWRFQWSSMW